MVQKPTTAKAQAMPEAALQAGPVDFVLSVEQMAEVLRAIGAPE